MSTYILYEFIGEVFKVGRAQGDLSRPIRFHQLNRLPVLHRFLNDFNWPTKIALCAPALSGENRS